MRLPFRHWPAATAALLLLAQSLPARAADYPHLAFPGLIRGTGEPYVLPDGSLDAAVLDKVSRFHLVTLDASPVSEYRPDVALALKARRPDLILLAYVLGTDIWQVASDDSLVHYPTRYRRLVRDLGGFLYNTSGIEYRPCNVNLAKRVNGRYVVAEAVASLLDTVVIRPGIWNGMFVDVFCEQLLWTQEPNNLIDIARAGYASAAEFEAAWKAGTDTLASRLRQYGGPSFVLIGNCAAGTKYPWFNGWNRENFPFQGGGDWYENMFRIPGGYFVDEASFRQPTHNYIHTWPATLDPWTAANTRKARFGLASAALGDGFPIIAYPETPVVPFYDWWYDEYAVDLATGQSSTRREHTGWLGQPLAPWFQMVWVGTNPDGVTNPGFETGTTGWDLWLNGGASATLGRDLAGPADGTASARVSIAASYPVEWYVTLASQASLGVSAGGTYSATFWARASSPRQVNVVLGAPGGGGFASRLEDIGTSWRRYQVILHPASSGTATLQFYLGLQGGDVWFDDVHFQAGATNLYRRDFQNGMVLVNPSNAALTVPLPAACRKILGTADPLTNDGSEVTQVTVPASDALFLLTRDTIPPAAIQNLRVIYR